jgi:hypothetical protein
MLESDKGFYLVSGYTSPIKMYYVVDVKEDYVTFAAFSDTLEHRSNMEWSWLESYLSKPYDMYNKSGATHDLGVDSIVSGFPLVGEDTYVQYKGRTTFFPDGMIGLDELTPYSLIDLATANGYVIPWRNRFALSAKEKIDTSFRHRAVSNQRIGLVIFMPIPTKNLKDARVEIVGSKDNILLLNNTTFDGVIDGPSVIPNDGKWYTQFYFSVASPENLTIQKDSTLDVPVHLVWNKEGLPLCEESVTLRVEEVNGQVVNKRLTTDSNGKGVIRLMAMGMKAGEEVSVKVNTEHFTSVGKIKAVVV